MDHGNFELVCDVLHRLFSLRERSSDDHDVMSSAALLCGQLDDRQCSAADVDSSDRMDDRELAGRLSSMPIRPRACVALIAARAPTSPNVTQMSVAIGVPPNSAEPASVPPTKPPTRPAVRGKLVGSGRRPSAYGPHGAGRDSEHSRVRTERDGADQAELVEDLIIGLLWARTYRVRSREVRGG